MEFIITSLLTMMDDGTDQSEAGAGARDQSEASIASHLCQSGEGQWGQTRGSQEDNETF